MLSGADMSSRAVGSHSHVSDNGTSVGVLSPLLLKDVVTGRKGKKGASLASSGSA